ncbi:MAG: isoprenylcysteine carboxylmethyltransferase family protein [Micropruina sp.]|nr:MAG: isoprenylcysteine carboxylmethyltransferase family protein [Micropruina sp.]
MRQRTVAALIGATYGTLSALWVITRRVAVRAFATQPLLTTVDTPDTRPTDLRAVARTTGVLWVFLANSAAIGLVAARGFSPTLAARLPRLRMPLPRAASRAGALLFVIDATWCTLALIFNPGYRPFFLPPKRGARLATQGPYALVRHPRYAGEAAFNVILPVFTGSWLPLLGVLGWPALHAQARREEEWLLRAAPEAYRDYSARAGRFPRGWPG